MGVGLGASRTTGPAARTPTTGARDAVTVTVTGPAGPAITGGGAPCGGTGSRSCSGRGTPCLTTSTSYRGARKTLRQTRRRRSGSG